MNKTLYIGAKCVPSFYIGSGGSSEWASGVPFEPLTVVTYNNTWFISKKPVPADAEAPETGEYWAQVPGYVTEVTPEELQAILDDIEDLREAVGDLDDLDTTAKTNLVSAVNEVKGETTELRDDLTNIENTVINDYDFLRINLPFVRGWFSGTGEFLDNYKTWATKEYLSTDDLDTLQMTNDAYLCYIVYYNSEKVYQTKTPFAKTTGLISVNKSYPYCRVSIGFLSSTDIVPTTAISTLVVKKFIKSDKSITATADTFQGMWCKGGVNSSTGALSFSSLVSYITPAFIDKRIHSVTPNAGYFVAIFAYEKGGYVGCYNGTTFTSSYAVRTTIVNFEALRETYPTYDYRLLIQKLDSTDTAVRENIVIIYNGTITEDYLQYREVSEALEQTRNMRSNSGSPLTLLHFSDIHGDKDRLTDIVKYLTTYSAYISDAICTGDIVAGAYPDGLGFWDAVEGAEDILTCIGNHDSVTAQVSGSPVPMADLCDTFIDPYIANWGTVTHPSDTTYYYKDYTSPSVRLIVLDCMNMDADQLAWLETALTDAKTNQLHVIIGIHYSAYPRNVVDCEFSPAKDMNNYMQDTIPAGVVSAVDTFQTGGGFFVCYLTGHNHLDSVLTLQGYPNQLDISITCATNSNAQFNKSDQYRYEVFSNAVNLVTVNTKEKTVSLKRLGANKDMFLRDRKVFCYDYGTHQLLN